MENSLIDARKQAGLSQAELARRVGTSREQIRRLEAGERKLTREWAERIAPHVQREPSQLLFDLRPVRVLGYVGAGDDAHFYDEAEMGEAIRPDNAGSNTVAVEIRGPSLGPHFNGWLAYYDDVRDPPTPDLIGHICIVGLSDGRVLVKTLRKAAQNGFYHLISETTDPIFDVEISWAARVIALMPRDLALL